MGKTYTTSLIAKYYDNIIILSPLRYLAFQTLEQYKKYLGKEYSPILISLDGKRKIKDIISHGTFVIVLFIKYILINFLIKIS